MGLRIYLQDEQGVVSEEAEDPHNLLHRQLTMMNDGILGGIDRYGDTTFNRLQMRQCIPAWTALISNAADPDERQILANVLDLAEKRA